MFIEKTFIKEFIITGLLSFKSLMYFMLSKVIILAIDISNNFMEDLTWNFTKSESNLKEWLNNKEIKLNIIKTSCYFFNIAWKFQNCKPILGDSKKIFAKEDGQVRGEHIYLQLISISYI